jgi:hypothetical protein
MRTAVDSAQEFALSPTLIGACLDDLTRVLADRPAVPENQRLSHANATRSLILSFQPQDTIQLLLAGQAVLFNALTADGARDVLGGMAERSKPPARSGVTAMGRIVAKHIDTLVKLQGGVTRRVARRAEAAEQKPTTLAQPPAVHVTPDHAPPDKAEAPAIETPADPAPAPAARPYPGREAMLASRSGRLSRRQKTRLAQKMMNVSRTAQAP